MLKPACERIEKIIGRFNSEFSVSNRNFRFRIFAYGLYA